MSNKLPNEEEKFAQISKEHVCVSNKVWSMINDHIEDGISFIQITLDNYKELKQPIPVHVMKELLEHSQEVYMIFRTLIHPKLGKAEDGSIVKIEEDDNQNQLHPHIKEIFSHYIGNDFNVIGFILGANIDDNKPLSIGYADRILRCLKSSQEILDRIKSCTTSE